MVNFEICPSKGLRVCQQVEPKPSEGLDLGDVLVGQTATAQLHLCNKGLYPLSYRLKWLQATPEPAGCPKNAALQNTCSHRAGGFANHPDDRGAEEVFSVTPLKGTLPAGASQPLSVGFNPGLGSLTWQRQLQVNVRGASSCTICVQVAKSGAISRR